MTLCLNQQNCDGDSIDLAHGKTALHPVTRRFERRDFDRPEWPSLLFTLGTWYFGFVLADASVTALDSDENDVSRTSSDHWDGKYGWSTPNLESPGV